ncbi:hypothetical protein Tco_0884934 [Tanacetum coccineum]
MQAEEQEKLSIKEKSKLFLQLLEERKKHFAAMRAQEKRNKPPTKAQKRNIMSTYLKNMVGYKHNQLKNKSFDDIQKLFDKAMKKVNIFVNIDTELVEGSEVRAEAEIAQKSSSKRAGEALEQESSKKQKVDEDKETAELQRLIKVVPDKEEVAINAIPLATKPPSIGDLKTMFDPHVEDQVWRNQQDYRVLDWKLYDSCGVHSLRKQNVHIHMLIEKRDILLQDLQSQIFYIGSCKLIIGMKCVINFLSSSQNNSRVNEVFGSILLVIMKLLMKKLDDFGDKYQV